LKKHSIYISALLLLVSIIVYFVWKHYSTETETVYILPVILTLLVASLVFLVIWTKAVTSARVFAYGINTVVMVFGVIVILILINFISYRQNYRKDFTEDQRFSISDQTQKVLKKLSESITITAFYQEGDMASRSKLEDLMEEYTHIRPDIKYEFIDPVKKPNEAMQYGIKQDGIVILEFSGGGWVKITKPTVEKVGEVIDVVRLEPLIDQEFSREELRDKLLGLNFSKEEAELILTCALSGNDKREKLSGEITEEALTNAIMKLLQEEEVSLYFLQGHNELSLEGDLSSIKEELTKEGYNVKELILLKDLHIPPDCKLLIIPGPEKELLEPEIEVINEYLKKGGKLMVMVDPLKASLKDFLMSWNVEVVDDIILDFSGIGQLFELNEVVPIGIEYPPHPVTEQMTNVATGFPLARSVSPVQGGNPSYPDITVQPLVNTVPERSYSYRGSLDMDSLAKLEIDPSRDVEGPVSLALAITAPIKEEEQNKEEEPFDPMKPPEEDKAKNEVRMIVIGNSTFVCNKFLAFQGNSDLFLNMTNWLTEQEDLISIRPKDPKMYTIDLSPQRSLLIFLITIIMFPLLLIITGVTVWLYRR